MRALIISVLFSFLSTYFMTPIFIKFLRACKIVGTDVQKRNKPKLVEMGAPSIIVGVLTGVFFFIWTRTFLYNDTTSLIQLLAAMSTFLIIGMIGIFDDLSCLIKVKKGNKGFEKYKRVGLKQWVKPLLTLPAAVPLMAIMAGNYTMTVPIFGSLDVGIIYPLVLVPLAVVGASNAINLLAGFNGLETGTSFVLLSSLGIFAFIHNEIEAALIGFTFAAALLAFLKYNWHPAKILPGDSMVYCIGAAVASIAIIGNMEKFALYCFAPWILEFLLKLRSKFKAENYGKLQKDGTLQAPYKKTYSLTHAVMKLGRFKEWQVSAILILFEVVVCILAFALCLGWFGTL